jgi:glycosyltransferase involved in cell wall biosynthesis
MVIVTDTGSTDGTQNLLRKAGAIVHQISVKPFRFDDARNAALAHIPADYDWCIALDLDEVLLPGWRKELEKLDPAATRARYRYIWSWNDDGTPGLEYGGDKIHRRTGYRWRHPVHEVLTAYGQDEVQDWCGLTIEHHPDNTKSRGQYFPLLEMAVAEDPHDDRNAFYLAREYYFHAMPEKAAAEFKRHLSLPKSVWPPERGASWRYLAKCEPNNAENYLLMSIKESPRREAYVELAQHYHDHGRWDECAVAAREALEIVDKPMDYLCESHAWGALPHDLLAIASHWLGDRNTAIRHGEIACELSPTDTRLSTNLIHYRE